MKSETLARVFRFVVIVGGMLAVISASYKMIRSPLATGDMESYLHAAHSILDGQDIYATPSRPLEAGGLYYLYPPLLAVLFIPFAMLPVSVSIVLWTVINVVLLAWVVFGFYEAMTGSSLSALKFKERWTVIFFALLPPSRFILHHLFYGQANILIMALTVAGLKQLNARKSGRGALSIGLSVALKVLTYPMTVWFLLKKNLKAVAGIVGGTVIGLLLPALVVGFRTNWNYLVQWFRTIALSAGVNNDKVPLYVNVSVQAQLYRFFGDAAGFIYQGRPHYLTVYQLPGSVLHVIELALPLLMLAAMVVYWYMFRNAGELVSHWGGVALTMALISVFTPFAQKHYLVFVVPAFLFLTHVWYRVELRDRWFHELVIASAVLLIFTNEDICGEYLGGLFTGIGVMAAGVVLACAAIFRAASCLNSQRGVAV
jgi:glycosyl transferase family 87